MAAANPAPAHTRSSVRNMPCDALTAPVEEEGEFPGGGPPPHREPHSMTKLGKPSMVALWGHVACRSCREGLSPAVRVQETAVRMDA